MEKKGVFSTNIRFCHYCLAVFFFFLSCPSHARRHTHTRFHSLRSGEPVCFCVFSARAGTLLNWVRFCARVCASVSSFASIPFCVCALTRYLVCTVCVCVYFFFPLLPAVCQGFFVCQNSTESSCRIHIYIHIYTYIHTYIYIYIYSSPFFCCCCLWLIDFCLFFVLFSPPIPCVCVCVCVLSVLSKLSVFPSVRSPLVFRFVLVFFFFFHYFFASFFVGFFCFVFFSFIKGELFNHLFYIVSFFFF